MHPAQYNLKEQTAKVVVIQFPHIIKVTENKIDILFEVLTALFDSSNQKILGTNFNFYTTNRRALKINWINLKSKIENGNTQVVYFLNKKSIDSSEVQAHVHIKKNSFLFYIMIDNNDPINLVNLKEEILHLFKNYFEIVNKYNLEYRFYGYFRVLNIPFENKLMPRKFWRGIEEDSILDIFCKKGDLDFISDKEIILKMKNGFSNTPLYEEYNDYFVVDWLKSGVDIGHALSSRFKWYHENINFDKY